MQIRICHLYPDLLNLYGDKGNILALTRRCEWRNLAYSLSAVSLHDTFDPDAYDLIFLGGGQDAEQELLREDLVEGKGASIKAAVEMDKVFLCICGGYQMMGKYYEEHDGTRLKCLGALNVWTIAEKNRCIGDTAYRTELLPEGKNLLYGFENHSGRTYLGEGVEPLAKVLLGTGNNGKDGTEGAVYRNVYCTYSHGSFLPKNPVMTDFLLEKALQSRYGEDAILSPLSYEAEEPARRTCPSYKLLPETEK